MTPLYKIGYGYDSHRFLNADEKKQLAYNPQGFSNETEFFSTDKKLIIGGVVLDDVFQQRYGPFKARSDGDVLYHATVNALLSACTLPEKRDIGTLFPNTSAENSNRSSVEFLQTAVDTVRSTSYELAELKIMLKGKPRVNLVEVEKNLRQFFTFQESPPAIHLQGTSGEEMDAAGNGLGVEVFAVCLLQYQPHMKKLAQLLR